MQIWAESGKSALPICNYSQILYQFLTFTQNLKRSLRLKLSPLPFPWQRAVFCLTVIEHPLIALQHCISLRCHTSCKESATPAEEIPELSAGQAEW